MEELKPKVLFLNSGALPLPAVKGGAVETLLDYLVEMNEQYKKMQIEIISIYDNAAKKASQKYKQTSYHYIKLAPIITKLDKILYWLAKKLLRRPNDIHFSHAFTMIFMYFKIAKLLADNDYDKVILEVNCSLFLTLKMRHNYIKYRDKYYFYLHNLAGKSYGCADIIRGCRKIICVSDYIRKSLPPFTQKMKSSQLAVHFNGMDSKRFCPDQYGDEVEKKKIRFGIKPDEKLVLFSGRLYPGKGVKELLLAFRNVEGTKAKLLIVGSFFYGKNIRNEFLDELKSIIEDIQDRVVFTGFIPYNEMPIIYAMADIAVLPSICEDAAPLTVIECMQSGLPIITTDSGGIPEYADNQCAFILKKDHFLIPNLTDRMNLLLRDRDLRIRMGHAAFERGQYFNLDNYYFNFLKTIAV